MDLSLHYFRTVAEQVVPRMMPSRASSTLLAVGDRYAQYRRYKRSASPAATKLIESKLGLVVRNGPFRGMRYPAENAYSRHAIPRLMGCYEEELHPALFKALADDTYQRFVDIGASDGYYGVGFAFATKKQVYAFEIDPFERRYTRLMASANGVQALVSLESWCGPQELRRICPDRSFILCDCEGYEDELFQPATASLLSHSDLVIELHPPGDSLTRSRLLERFISTHDIQCISARPRYAENCADLARLGLVDDSYISEYRHPGQQWAVLTAKSH